MTQEYIVQKGDTLWGISRHFGKTVEQLIDWNDLHGQQVHDLKVGQKVLLKSADDDDQPDLVLTIHLLDLAFKPIPKATLRLGYDGQSHTIKVEGGITPLLPIEDHSKGLKVYFKNIHGQFDLISDHKTLHYGGKKTLTLTSRMVKVSGTYAPEKGIQHQTTSAIQRQLKADHQDILKPVVSSPAPKAVPTSTSASEREPQVASNSNSIQASAAPAVTQATQQPALSSAEIKPINQTIRTDGGAYTHVVAVQFTEDNLLLTDGNRPFQKFIVNAAKAHGFAPQALAALIDTEAAKIGKGRDKHWNSDSKNDKTSAGGLSQFLDAAWLDMCVNYESLVCQYVNNHSKIGEGAKLKLKFNPEFAIDAAAVYAADNIAQLGKKPYNLPVDKITDPAAKAKLAYLTHHEGAKGAYRFIMDQDNSDAASDRLGKQLNTKKDPKASKKYIARFQDAKTAYAIWFRSMVDSKIVLQHFTTQPDGKDSITFQSEASLDSVVVALGGKSYALVIPAAKTAPPKTKSSQPANAPDSQTTNIASPPASATETTGIGGANTWHDPLASCVLRTAGLANVRSATFGMVRNNGQRAHQGVDLAAEPGTSIYAVASGTVAAINNQDVGDYGKFIVLQVNADDLPDKQKNCALNSIDKDGNKINPQTHHIYFFYAHLDEIGISNDGSIVIQAGQILGKTGHTGNAKEMTTIAGGAHLHFEARLIPKTGKGLGERVDPITFINTPLPY